MGSTFLFWDVMGTDVMAEVYYFVFRISCWCSRRCRGNGYVYVYGGCQKEGMSG